MAIVNSLAIGKSVKSAGNLTYKTVRGRTIASQRITENKSNTPLQQAQRISFTNLSQAMQFYQGWIDRCYEKSKYGSARNNFAKTNPKFNAGNLLGEIKEGIATPGEGIVASYALPSGVTTRVISQFAKGSLPCIVNETTSVEETVTFGGGTYQNVLVCDKLDIVFTTPVELSKFQLLAVFSQNGPSASTFDVEFCTISESGEITLPGALDMDVTTKELVVLNGMVSRFTVEYGNSNSVCQLCPIVDGKVPNIRSMSVGSYA